jgi:hypothetical protein
VREDARAVGCDLVRVEGAVKAVAWKERRVEMMMGDLRVRWFILDVQKLKSNEALLKINKCSNYGWMEIKGNANDVYCCVDGLWIIFDAGSCFWESRRKFGEHVDMEVWSNEVARA